MVNPLIYEDHLARGKAHPNRYDFLPDPVSAISEMTKLEARKTLGLPVDGKYVGCIGMMDKRKAIPELLAAFVNVGFPRDVRLLLAGRLDPAYAQLLDDKYAEYVREERIVILNRDLTENELRCGYTALDLHAVLQYRRFNLSANALKCVAFARPFICDNVGFTAMIAKRFSAGITCVIDDTKSVQSALRQGLAKDLPELQTRASRSLIEYHSNDNFARVALNSVMGSSAANVLGHTYRWNYAYSPVADLQAA